MSMTATQAQQLYVAYFNRPADTLGLAYWTGKPAAQASAAFSTSAEYTATYAGMSNAQIVNAIYLNLFGRPANDLPGLTFWANHLTNGTLTVSNVVTSIAAAAQGTDLVAYNSKVTAATAFTAALDTAAEVIAYSGTAANNAAKTWLSGITTDATLTTATTTAALNASIATVVTVGGPAGSTFALTTGVDTFTGTSGNDTFNADNTGAAVVLSSADVLNGGSGDDTLNVYSTGNAFNLPTLTSIETLNVYDQNANQSIAAANFASVTTANLIRGDGALTLTGGANLATVGVSDVVAATGGVVLAFEAARTSATINLNGVTAAGGATDENVDVNGAALTTVTVNTTGTASSFDVLDVASATTIAINAAVGLTATSLETGATSSALTITGAGAVSLGTLDTAINTVTASTATGALTAAIGGETDTVVTLGSGNDVITAGTTDALVAANALAVNAGAGTGDVLVVVETVDVDTAADAARYTNFEVVPRQHLCPRFSVVI